LTGLECLERLRLQSERKLPVLLFTADWDVADEADRIASLHVMFASKLCDLEEVARLVGSLLSIDERLAMRD